MLIDIDIVQKRVDCNFSIFLKLQKSMIDSCLPFLSDILSYIVNKELIIDLIFMREVVFDCSYFLGCQKNSSLVQKQIEGVLRHSSTILTVKFRK